MHTLRHFSDGLKITSSVSSPGPPRVTQWTGVVGCWVTPPLNPPEVTATFRTNAREPLREGCNMPGRRHKTHLFVVEKLGIGFVGDLELRTWDLTSGRLCPLEDFHTHNNTD
ncbi:unnamed protein product [Boreogadus saida]